MIISFGHPLKVANHSELASACFSQTASSHRQGRGLKTRHLCNDFTEPYARGGLAHMCRYGVPRPQCSNNDSRRTYLVTDTHTCVLEERHSNALTRDLAYFQRSTVC